MTSPEPEAPPSPTSRSPIAIVGLACRLPDADDSAALLDAVLTGRRAFRRIPPARLDLAEYFNPDPRARDATYSTRAALLEGWRFDLAAFGVSVQDFAGTDPAHWLALETAASALTAAGFPGGDGLPGERTGVFIGNAPARDGAPAAALRLRWPYTRRVLAEALAAAGVPPRTGREVLAAAAARYLAPFPAVSAGSLAGGSAAAIATTICARFGLRGGGLTADAGAASSLAAITSACLALTAGQIDAAVAGGVDLSIDPYELVALAKSGRLARADMRVYDASPTGFLPGEGCGAVLLMRAADARAKGLPVCAEIVGWGTASRGGTDQDEAADNALGPEASTRLLAMRRAHEMAGLEPADVQLIEGSGAGTGAADDAELAALAELRSESRHVAALGSITANIGNTGAAAGTAGLIKAVLSIANGVLPPATGVRTPHPMLREGHAALRLPATAERWPAGTRHAGVAATGPHGLAYHLLLRGEPGEHIGGTTAPELRPRVLPRAAQTRAPSGGRSLRQARLRAKTPLQPQTLTVPALRLAATRATGSYARGPGHTFAYLLRARDRDAMVRLLSRIALIAPWLSDAQMQDLAVNLARSAATGQDEPGGQGEPPWREIRLALTASSQEQLASLARSARVLVPAQPSAPLSIRPGIYLAAGPVAAVDAAGSDRAVGSAAHAGSRPVAEVIGAAGTGGTGSTAADGDATDTADAAEAKDLAAAAEPVAAAQPSGGPADAGDHARAADQADAADLADATDQADAAQAGAADQADAARQVGLPGTGERAVAAGKSGSLRAADADAPGSVHAASARPNVALVISGSPDELTDLPQRQLSRILAILRLLDDLGVDVAVAVGHGVGEVAGLVWAGCATPSEARTLIALRSAALAAPSDAAPGELGNAIGKFGTFRFRPPRRRLVSGCTGSEVTEPGSIAGLLSAELLEARLATGAGVQAFAGGRDAEQAGSEIPAAASGAAAGAEFAEVAVGADAADGRVSAGAPGGGGGGLATAVPAAATGLGRTLGPALLAATEEAALVVLTGQDRTLGRVVAELGMGPVSDGEPGSPLPAVSIDGDPADDAAVARAAAALFAAGAMSRPEALYAKRPSRPIDIWRDPVFITHPCQRPVRMARPRHTEAPRATNAPPADAATTQAATTKAANTKAANTKAATTQAANTKAATTKAATTKAATTKAATTKAATTKAAAPGMAALAAPPGSPAGSTRQAAPPRASAGPHRGRKSPDPDRNGPAARNPAAGLATSAGDPAAIHTRAGAKQWFRCYAEETRPPALQVPTGDDEPWRLFTGGCGPLDRKVREVFRHDGTASRTLVVLGRLDDPATSQAAVLAASDAIRTGQLVAISAGPGPAGLWASLHAEHPAVGITVIRAPLTADGVGAAQRIAAAQPGEFRELVIGEDGAVCEPAMLPIAALGGAGFPLGPEDVVLISRGSGAPGLTLAQVVACGGAAVAIVGRFHPAGDEQVIAGIEQMRGAGARIGYELVDLADHAALVAAVRRIEARFGCVTAIGHATGSLPRVAVTNLTPQAVHGQVRAHTAPLDQLAAAVRAVARSGSSARRGNLRLIVTCGSVTGRYGLASEGIGAYVTGALADFGARTATNAPGCVARHIDWPAWSGEAVGERAELADAMARTGFTAMPVGEASRLLLKALGSDGLPGRLAIHGRVGVPAPRPISVASALGQSATSERFIERILVHYPGVELIAEARLSLLADPYLGDYQADGVPVLPPTMALEAMAQAASTLAGAPVRRASQVTMRAPIVLPAGMPGSQTVIRIYALRDGDTITVTVRSDNSGFAVDHCRATFSLTAAEVTASDQAAGSGDEQAAAGPGTGARELPAAALYGRVLFQAGRFRLLTGVLLNGPRSAATSAAASAAAFSAASARRAGGNARAASQPPWFGTVPPERATTAQDLILGSAAVSDAALQVVQACLPGRRMLFSGCDAVWFSDAFCEGQIADGPVTITAGQDANARAGQDGAKEEDGSNGSAAETEAVPRQRAGAGESSWPAGGPAWLVRVTDASGQALISWHGLRMRDAGPLHEASLEVTRLVALD